MEVWMLVVGGVLLLAVGYDAISTTLSIGAAAGPLTARIGSMWWKVASRLARRPTSPIMVSAGPVVVLMTVTAWLGLLWGGWTLVFLADPDAVVSSMEGDPAAGWSRVYFAGFVAFSLGVGDYVPNGQAWEVLSSIAVITGLALTTLAVTFLIPVVSAVTARRVQANAIAGMGSTPEEIVLNAYRGRRLHTFEHRLQGLADGLLETAERHLSYPVLHYFHPSERHVDLRAQLTTLDETITLLQHGVAEQSAPDPMVLADVRHAVQQLVRRAIAEPIVDAALPTPDLGPLRRAGIPTVDDQSFRRRLEEIAEHRRRLATFTNESLWSREDRHGQTAGGAG